MALIVQLLARNGKVLQQNRLTQDEITIGRGYQNDFRIEDPYVCANHLQINNDELSDTLICQDLESVNGTKLNGSNISTATIRAEDVVVVGRTRLRVFQDDLDVPVTLKLSAFEENTNWLNNKALTVALSIVLVAFIVYNNYLSTFESLKTGKLIFTSVGQVILISLWPLFFAALARLNKKDGRVISQINLMWIYLLLMETYSYVGRIVDFNVDSSWLIDSLDFVFYLATFFALIWLTLFIAFHQSTLKRYVISTGISVLVLVGIYYDDITIDDKFSARPGYALSLLPHGYQYVTPKSTDEFLRQSEILFEKLNEQKN